MLTLSPSELPGVLRSCLAVTRWVDEVCSAAPFGSDSELLAAARAALAQLSTDEVTEALAGHPRIGDKPAGTDAAANFSRREQASPDSDDVPLQRALAEGNRDYEARFNRVFLIRAAGRSRAEILAELTRRLKLSEPAEMNIVVSELTEITLLRLDTVLERLNFPVKGGSLETSAAKESNL